MGTWVLALYLAIDSGVATIPQYQNQQQCVQEGERWKAAGYVHRYVCLWHPHPYTLPPGAR